MAKEIVEVTGCPCCGSWYELKPEFYGFEEHDGLFKRMEKKARWLKSPKECWNCHQQYIPAERKMRMDDFVFDAFNKVKM